MAKVKLLDPSDPRRKLDRYELIGEIATGGMATVFLARLGGVGGFQRFVAIKRLHPHLANEQEFVEMFLDEARLAALIHHPHVVPILEVGVTDAGYYIVMEYVEGDTLSKIVARSMSMGKMMPRHILMRSLLDTLAGLHAAHDLADDRGQLLGLVHRDVSPQNVLVGADGSTRITDFGVARATARLTSTGSGKLKGKLAYMAPEQTRGDELDRRTDLFAAGIIVWECLAGKRLFKAETEAATLNRILVEPVRPLSEVNPEVPRVFDFFIRKALDRDPAQRFQTALDMGDALERTALEAVKNTGETGIASAREVAGYVTAILGQEIGAQRESVRAWLAQSDSGQPRITLPPRRRMGSESSEDSDSGARRAFSGAAAFAPTDFSPLGAGLRDSAELPATRVEPALASTPPPPPVQPVAEPPDQRPIPAVGSGAPGHADSTMRFALDGSPRRDRPPPREPAPSITDISPRPPHALPSTPGVPPPRASTRGAPRPGRSGQDTLPGPAGADPAPRNLGATVPARGSGASGLATTALTEDNEDLPTILNAKDAPPPGTIPVHKDPSKAVVVPDVKTARGLFASEVLPLARAHAAANGVAIFSSPQGQDDGPDPDLAVTALHRSSQPAVAQPPPPPPPPPPQQARPQVPPPPVPVRASTPAPSTGESRPPFPAGARTASAPNIAAPPALGSAPPPPPPPPPASQTPTTSLTNGSMTLPSETASVSAELRLPYEDRGRSRLAVGLVIGGLVACVVFGVWFFTRTPSPLEASPTRTSDPTVTARSPQQSPPTSSPVDSVVPPPTATASATASATAATSEAPHGLGAPWPQGRVPGLGKLPTPAHSAGPKVTPPPTSTPHDTPPPPPPPDPDGLNDNPYKPH